GFSPASIVTIGGVSAPVLSSSNTELLVRAPQISSGLQPIVVTDPATNLQSTFPAALQFGATTGDHLEILSAPFGTTSTGSETDHEFVVRALDVANLPLAGTPITLTITPTTAALLLCNAATCDSTADSLGRANT